MVSAKLWVVVGTSIGRQRWRHPWESSRDVNAPDLLVAGDKAFIASSRVGVFLQLRDGPPTVVGTHANLMHRYFNPAVLVDGHRFVIDNATHRLPTLTCLDWATGRLRRSEPGFAAASWRRATEGTKPHEEYDSPLTPLEPARAGLD